jgi:hypothetical protein
MPFRYCTLSPDVVALMGDALETAWQEVQARGHGAANSDADRLTMARAILRLVSNGERDVARMQDAALLLVIDELPMGADAAERPEQTSASAMRASRLTFPDREHVSLLGADFTHRLGGIRLRKRVSFRSRSGQEFERSRRPSSEARFP